MEIDRRTHTHRNSPQAPPSPLEAGGHKLRPSTVTLAAHAIPGGGGGGGGGGVNEKH